MSTNKQTPTPTRVTTCPQCSADLNAILKITLYAITLEDGSLVDYDGGPQPESEADIIELCQPDNTIIVCEAGHILNSPDPSPGPVQVLPFKAGYGYNSTYTGDYYIFAGLSNGLYTFYRPFSEEIHRLTEDEASTYFDPTNSKGKADAAEARAASESLHAKTMI